jgi:hypothetical protein
MLYLLMNIICQYFSLQFTMIKRHLIDLGVHPFVGIVFLTLFFYGLSFYVFTKTEYAHYLYLLAALSMMAKYAENDRKDFLKFTYPVDQYYKIRVLENLITALPFVIFLGYKNEFFSILLLVICSIIITFLNVNKKVSFTLPTPFYKRPFEFLVGFRKSLLGFLFAYYLCIMSLVAHNFNLGLFSLALVFLVCLSFYTEIEHEYYVWIYNFSVKQFLFDKLITAVIYSTLIASPIALTILIYFNEDYISIMGIMILGYFYLMTFIMAKYTTYPLKINLPQGVILAFSLSFPPLILAIAPYFYIKSSKRLKEYLR